MTRPLFEVADVVVRHAAAYLAARGGAVPSAHRRVLRNLAACRTAALGGHIDRCDRCDYERPSYNSCGDRHCPKCQAAARADWLEQRQADLLPVEYFHVVFTVPPPIADLALQNKRVVYDILFKAAARTLLQIAADPRHLGAQIGFLAVLHTWGQNLLHHPHVHCVVPGGGLSPDGTRWIACPAGFFLPVAVLSPVFRGKFLALLRRAFHRDELRFDGELKHLADPDRFAAYLKTTYAKQWVVYAKPPFGGPNQVLKYLARYTHRVAISNHRIIAVDEHTVSFRYKDYAHGSVHKTMQLDGVEFLRRFLLHVLPRGFVRIRHFGFLANSCRTNKLAQCRAALNAPTPQPAASDGQDASSSPSPLDTRTCPICGHGKLIRYEVPRPSLRPARVSGQVCLVDTS